MAKYQQYEEYKDSGVEWLGDIPSHWQPVPIKYLASEKDTLFLDGDWIESKDISDSGIRYITTGNVGEGQYKEQGTGFISDQVFQKLNCSEVFEQDILISRLNLPIGRACLVPNLNNRIVTSVDNVILRPDAVYSKQFLVHLFSSSEYFHNTANLARGATMQRISRGLLGNIRISLPKKEEQIQIANFLDHETAKIDTLIEKQQTLIQLLKEKRQAVISHAVTKGLNPNAPMKDSGVEWLGEVPEHWNIVKLSYRMKLLSGDGITSQDIEPTGQYPVYGGNGLRGYTDRYNCEGHHVLIGRQGALCGNINLAQGKFFATEHAVVVYPYQDFNISFLSEFLRFMDLGQYSVSAAQPGISVERINGLKILVPPYYEQTEIGEHVENIIKRFEDLSTKANQQIKLLQERRTALISAAVTGKIDVRGWRAPE